MPIVWCIDNAPAEESAVVRALIGHFPVRHISSQAGAFEAISNSGRSPDIAVLVGPPERDVALRECLLRRDVLVVGASQIARCGASGDLRSSASPVANRENLAAILLDMYQSRQKTDPRTAPAPLKVCNSAAGVPEPNALVLSFGDISLDLEQLSLSIGRGGSLMDVSKTEARILRMFLRRPGQKILRSEILSEVWRKTKVSLRTVDSHVSRLRRRLAGSGAELVNVYGDGYILRQTLLRQLVHLQKT